MEKKKGSIRIISRLYTELSSPLVINGEEYLVQTESGGTKNPFVITRIYHKGKILLTRKTDYKNIIGSPDMEVRVYELMQGQHKFVINMFKAEKSKTAKTKTPAGYLEDVKLLLGRKNAMGAFEVLCEAMEQYPDDPFIRSYYGCLEAVVNRNYRNGIDSCKMAINALREKLPFGEEFFYPVLYLNLGRAYLAAGQKKNALGAFNKGLRMDNGNRDIIRELRTMGIRRSPVVSFLPRSNPINKYIGMLLHRLRK